MDGFELLWNACLGCSIGLPLWALAGIALRVACHWSGLEIPTMGKAMFIVFATALPTVVVVWILQVLFVGVDGNSFHPVLQFLVFAIALGFHAAISTLAYSQLLRARAGQALSIWIVSSLILVLVSACCTCVIGVPVYLIRRDM